MYRRQVAEPHINATDLAEAASRCALGVTLCGEARQPFSYHTRTHLDCGEQSAIHSAAWPGCTRDASPRQQRGCCKLVDEALTCDLCASRACVGGPHWRHTMQRAWCAGLYRRRHPPQLPAAVWVACQRCSPQQRPRRQTTNDQAGAPCSQQHWPKQNRAQVLRVPCCLWS